MAFTEFYCLSGGSNLNGGSDTSTTATYTSTNGDWSTATNIFTPSDGSNPVTAGVTVGQFASLYVDGASVGVYLARVTAVTNAVNGTITVSSTVKAGTAPTTSGTARSIKVGGAFQGPNGSTFYPLVLSGFGNLKNTSGNLPRLNLKNDQTYTMTGVASGETTTSWLVQGYTSTPGDLGKANIDGGSASTGAITTQAGGVGSKFIDIKFSTTISAGTAPLVTDTVGGHWERCIFTGSRGSGLFCSTGHPMVVECEFYDCNKSNSASNGILDGATSDLSASYCYIHDSSAGASVHGIRVGASATITNTIIDSISGSGVLISGTIKESVLIENNDFYNITVDGITVDNTAFSGALVIRNNNFLKCAGKGINNLSSAMWGQMDNNGFGSGTQANGGANVLGSIVDTGTSVTYASGVTPWAAQGTGNFNIALAAAVSTGRGFFTQTGSGKSGSVGYPDIGAVQSLHFIGLLENSGGYVS